MKTHVFVVNEKTFPIHLKYLFAGTGAGEKDEHISLLCDIKRVRPNDFVVFYIEATKNQKGGFYGIFKISEQEPLVFHTSGKNGYQPELSKKLIYRTLLKPYEVYSEKVLEFEALDKLPTYATEIQWSLIYRKLKGQRGCTPLLPWEAQRLFDMIRNKNNGIYIASHNFDGGFDFDFENQRILTNSNRINYELPRNFEYRTLDVIRKLFRKQRAYENHLQLYFVENIGTDSNLKEIVGENIIWFGNEIACGVGMQKIDILVINQINDKKFFRIIELKDEPVKPDIVEQIKYYVNWGSQDNGKHLEGAFSWNIQPIIVAPEHNKRRWNSLREAFLYYNDLKISLPILYFEFVFDENSSLIFHKVNYD